MTSKTIPELSVDTRLLYQRILKLNPDETISYAELSAVIGRDVTGSARSNLFSARNKALREGINTEAVTKVGIKRLTDTQTVGTTDGRVRDHIRRVTGKAVKKLATVDFNNLSNPDKVKHNTAVSHLGALRAFAADKIAPRIERKVKESNGEQLAIVHTLQAFEGPTGK